MQFDWLAPLLTLTAMEIVLGIDNVILIAVVVGRMPAAERRRARRIGLGMALAIRVLLLLGLRWVLSLTEPLFVIFEQEFSWRDLILLGGGLFLIAKSTYEIHDNLEGSDDKPATGLAGRFGWIVAQIIVLDLIFSLDSVITAIGMATPDQLWIMVTAMLLAVVAMLFFSGAVSGFVEKHPTIKMLALSFLILIGVMLIAEAFKKHIDRGYIYFAMAFSLLVELLNMRLRARGKPVELHQAREDGQESGVRSQESGPSPSE